MAPSVTVRFFIRNEYVNGVATRLSDVATYEDVPYRIAKRARFAYSKGLALVKSLPFDSGDILGVYVYDNKDRLLAAWRQMDNYGGRMTGTHYDPFGNLTQHWA